MIKVNWQDHFKGAFQNAEKLYSKDSTEVSLLMFCLRSKLIPTAEYLSWAKENFQIPVLSEKYLQIHKPQQELYKKWQKVYKWTNECLPIAEWDGVLIIACLELPENYNHSNPTTFVLTSTEVLDQTWQIYKKSQKTTATIPTGDVTDMTALAATVVATKAESDSFLDDNGEIVLQRSEDDNEDIIDEEISVDSTSDAEASEESLEGMEVAIDEEAAGMPEGLFGDSPAPKFAGLTDSTKSAPSLVSLQPLSQTDAPKEHNIEAEEEVLVQSTPVKESAMLKKGPRTSEPLMETLDEKTKIDDFPNMEDMEEVADHEVDFPDKKQISPVASVVAGDFPSAPVKPTMKPGSAAAYYLEKIRKQTQETFDKEVIASFQNMKTFFKKSMLLGVGDKDRMVKPILWDDTFEVQTPTTSEFNLKTPSIFRVVSGTQKPYHGYIVPNDLNESFFESWNHGQIPDHITIVPLMDGDLVVGMIMGFGEKASYNKNVLTFTENIVKDLTAKIIKAPPAKAA